MATEFRAGAPAARAVACHICGKQFFPASLKFHVKACEKKQATIEVPCPFCDMDVRRCDMEQHVRRCEVARRQRQQRKRQQRQRREQPAERGHGRSGAGGARAQRKQAGRVVSASVLVGYP